MPNSIKYKIVFVDDEDTMRKMYASCLSKTGFIVYDFANAIGDFVGKVAKIKPDLISLDVIMQGRTGFETIKLLKEDNRTKDIPVFFLTNLSDPKDRQEGVALGAVGYLVKAQHIPSEVAEKYIKYLETHRKQKSS